jgi:hypothetical protein
MEGEIVVYCAVLCLEHSPGVCGVQACWNRGSVAMSEHIQNIHLYLREPSASVQGAPFGVGSR